MTLDEYRRQLGWSIAELARQSRLDTNTVRRALSGESISGRTATALASAISEGLGQTIHYTQIKGLNVSL
jgi:transcriptional regulator with XRE-family HTH domain